MGYRLTAPMAQVEKADGSHVHLEEGSPVPKDISEASLQNLVDLGFVEETEDDGDASGIKPTASASKAKWVAYAVAQGFDEDAAKALSRDELVELYSDED